jgi:hypothetical protein
MHANNLEALDRAKLRGSHVPGLLAAR